jgi:hypothetical protein
LGERPGLNIGDAAALQALEHFPFVDQQAQ